MSFIAPGSSMRFQRQLLPLAGVLAAVALGAVVSVPLVARAAIAVSVAVPLVVLAVYRPTAALYALVVWLAILGTVRRVSTGVGDAFSSGDPLLLVEPVILSVLAAFAIQRGALRRRTQLTYAVMILGGMLALSALNPLQGGISVGLGGILLVVVPMFAFLIGRSLASDEVLRRLLGLFAVLAIPAAAYGLVQTFGRFPSWDQRWIDQSGYAALNVNGVVRAFGSFASSAEYATFLVIGVVCWMTLGWASRWRTLVIPVVMLFAVAIWFESARGAVVLLVAALGLMLAARMGLGLGRSLVLGAIAVAAIPWVVSSLAPGTFGANPASTLAAHQVRGLSDPLGQGSTLPGHFDLVLQGLATALHEPLGRGVGSVTIAASKLGTNTARANNTVVGYAATAPPGASSGSTEVDPGNAAVATGLLGLGAYILVAVVGVGRAFRQAVRRRDALALAALGVLVGTFFQWLNGGQYAVALVPWFVLGWLDRPEGRTRDQRIVR